MLMSSFIRKLMLILYYMIISNANIPMWEAIPCPGLYSLSVSWLIWSPFTIDPRYCESRTFNDDDDDDDDDEFSRCYTQ